MQARIFSNYKHSFSVILMAVAPPDYKCLYADVGTNGRISDKGDWNKVVVFHFRHQDTYLMKQDHFLKF